MSEAKFTKGEWKIYEYKRAHPNNPSLPHVTIHYGEEEEHIVDTVYEIADAHLIASAPEMYAALEHILDNQALGSPLALSINNLLAKARGEQCQPTGK